MKVSILVTFYNQEKYVDRALQSVFDQQCDFDFEVLVGDDGSTDATMDKLLRWQEKYPDRMKIYTMERKAGVKYNGSQRASRNRLNLLEHVQGEYFAYLDGDDFYIDKNKLKKQVDILDSPQNRGYAMCAHNVYAYDEEKGTNTPFLACGHVMKLKNTTYWGRFYFHPDSILMRSEYIPRIPKDVVLNYFNDNTITFCFLKYGGIYYLPDIMASYSQTGDGIWTGSSKFIGSLRNMMDYDLEMKLAPEFKRYSLIRHRADMRALLRDREPQDEKKLAFYMERIRKDGLHTAGKWLYCSLGKGRFDGKMRILYYRAIVLYVLYHVKWLIVDQWIRKN